MMEVLNYELAADEREARATALAGRAGSGSGPRTR